MEINATLLLQGIHFIIAWVLLKKILLRASYTCIEDRQNYIDALEKSIASEQELLKERTQERDDCIRSYCRYFKSHAPSVSKIQSLYFFEPKRIRAESSKGEDELVEKHIERIIALKLKEKLEHVWI